MIALLIFITLFAISLTVVVTQQRPPDSASRFARTISLIARTCAYVVVIYFGLIFVGTLFGPRMGGIREAPESAAMQTTRTLALAMFQYANDNDNQYPDGASSTEVFQKLMDGNYITDPSLFYIPMWGKTPARAGAKLRPENVCFDVTSGIKPDSPDTLPIVFVTGFRIDYRKDGKAVSLVRPFPSHHNRNSFPWAYTPFSGLAVANKSNSAWFREGQPGPDGFGVVPNVLPADFDPGGETYRQLTPEGVLR